MGNVKAEGAREQKGSATAYVIAVGSDADRTGYGSALSEIREAKDTGGDGHGLILAAAGLRQPRVRNKRRPTAADRHGVERRRVKHRADRTRQARRRVAGIILYEMRLGSDVTRSALGGGKARRECVAGKAGKPRSEHATRGEKGQGSRYGGGQDQLSSVTKGPGVESGGR
jgi:hypothetical protein